MFVHLALAEAVPYFLVHTWKGFEFPLQGSYYIQEIIQVFVKRLLSLLDYFLPSQWSSVEHTTKSSTCHLHGEYFWTV